MYQIIGHPNSRAVRLAWAMEEMGLDWSYTLAGPQSDLARQYNASGKVPILLDGETAIVDSVAGMTYLADKHGLLTAEAGTPARGLQDSMTAFACEEVDGALWLAAKHRFALPEAQRVPEIKETALWEWNRAMTVLETRLKGPFAMGETMSIPDIVLGQCAGWARSAKFDWPEGQISDYFAELQDSPSLARARAKGKEVLGES